MGLSHEEFVACLALDPVATAIHMSIAVCSVVVLVTTGATFKHLDGWRLDRAVVVGVAVEGKEKFESPKTLRF